MSNTIKIQRALGQMNHAELKEVLEKAGLTTDETTKANIVKFLEASDNTFEVEIKDENKEETMQTKKRLTTKKHTKEGKVAFTYVRVLKKNGTISHYETLDGRKLPQSELTFSIVRKAKK